MVTELYFQPSTIASSPKLIACSLVDRPAKHIQSRVDRGTGVIQTIDLRMTIDIFSTGSISASSAEQDRQYS